MTNNGAKKKTFNQYPKELLIKRQSTEGNFVIGLWNEPDLYAEYNHVDADIDLITPDGKFYFELGKAMYLANIKEFNLISIDLFLGDKPDTKAQYDRLGGYSSVSEMMSLIDPSNVAASYEELVKNNIILSLYDLGFRVENNLSKYNTMDSTALYDYFEYQLNSIFTKKVEKLQPENLCEGYDEYVEAWNNGAMQGFPIGFPLLNYRLVGVHKKNLLLHLAHIGNGKTTSSILFYILPAIEQGENVCIIANEQGVEEFRQMILSTVLFNKIGYFKINRHRFVSGGFSPDDLVEIKKAQEWLRNSKGQIMFIETKDYSVANVKKIVRQYSKVGYGLFVFDTLKPEDDSAERAWGSFSEVAKELFAVAKREDVAIVATAQLSGESASRRFLDLSCTGKSKAIAETAGQVVMFRTMSVDEKEKLKVYRFHRDIETGKYTNMKDEIPLDPTKDYIILFTPKNRFGDTGPQIVYERNMSWNTLREIGYTQITYDGFGFRR